MQQKQRRKMSLSAIYFLTTIGSVAIACLVHYYFAHTLSVMVIGGYLLLVLILVPIGYSIDLRNRNRIQKGRKEDDANIHKTR